MLVYTQNIEELNVSLLQLKKQLRNISLFRALIFVGLLTVLFKYSAIQVIIALPLIALLVGAFVLLMHLHYKYSQHKIAIINLIKVNQYELDYLNKDIKSFDNGVEYINTQHPYSFDLDIFGENGLFHHLNRAATFIGKETLAFYLLKKTDNNHIPAQQVAIQELSQKITWRQKFLSNALMIRNDKENYEELLKWAQTSVDQFPKWYQSFMTIMPVLFICTALLIYVNPGFFYLSTFVFIINIVLFLRKTKAIHQELLRFDRVSYILGRYSLLLKDIETANFTAADLNTGKEQLKQANIYSSDAIKKISSIFSNLESSYNQLGALLLNGTTLYHLHVLNSLYKWKNMYAKEIKQWLMVIGKFEALNSFANFAYNNPSFCYPVINSQQQMVVKNMGHPLVKAVERVCNDISFANARFMIITGSNMSGKSTFLRTLGVNMVLTNAGAPICAEEAYIYPMDILVSMRQSDSLNKGESYFFAEVRRLKDLMNILETQKPHFVLLDEILKGTNSEDKRYGTEKVIERIIQFNTIGCIATHDVEVCTMAEKYPAVLTNKYFESTISDNELHFDYKLKTGICRSRNATALMKQMGIC